MDDTFDPAAPVLLPIRTYADGFGLVHADVEFSVPLSESDPRPPFNLEARMDQVRRAARDEVLAFLAEREQRTGEDPAATRARLRPVVRLRVSGTKLDSQNLVHGIGFVECSADEDPVQGLDRTVLGDISTEDLDAVLLALGPAARRGAWELDAEGRQDQTLLHEAVSRAVDEELASRGAFLAFDHLPEDAQQVLLDAAARP